MKRFEYALARQLLEAGKFLPNAELLVGDVLELDRRLEAARARREEHRRKKAEEAVDALNRRRESLAARLAELPRDGYTFAIPSVAGENVRLRFSRNEAHRYVTTRRCDNDLDRLEEQLVKAQLLWGIGREATV